MKDVVLKSRPAARGSIGEEGVRRPLPMTKLVLKPRPLARGTIGLMGLRRAVLSGGSGYSSAVEDKSVMLSSLANSMTSAVSCKSVKAAAKDLQEGEIAVSLSEDESDEDLKEVSGVHRNELCAR